MLTMNTAATKARACEALAYYEARANQALADGDLAAHIVWARRWHALNAAMGG